MLVERNLSRGSVDWLERAALAGSFACTLHCLALPLLIVALPAVASALSIPESVHLWILAGAIPAAAIALAQGWRGHRMLAPVVTGIAGIALLVLGATLFEGASAETPITVTGSLLLAAAHIANWRTRHACAA